MLKYLFALVLLLPSAAFAQSPPPVAIPHKCDVWYPPDLQHDGVEGTTVLSFRIKRSGSVSHVEVTQSSGNYELDEAALHCVRTWIYFPATRGGQPVEVDSTAKIIWQLPEAAPASPAPPAPAN